MFLLGALALATAAVKMKVHELDPALMNTGVARHKRFMVVMHQNDATIAAFQPWLFALANNVPGVPIGRLDVSTYPGVGQAFQVNGTGPAIKLFQRQNKKGKRLIDYTGPLEFDPLLDWLEAVGADREHELSAWAVEPPEPPQPSGGEGSKSGSGGGRKNMMGALPESVRQMAETMVRETRLQRLLKEQGGGRLEQYDQMVHAQYQKLVQDEGTDMNDKWSVQEANRRARDLVRDEVLKEAPQFIKEEVLSDVNMGDMAQNAKGDGHVGAIDGGGGGSAKKQSKGAKDEL